MRNEKVGRFGLICGHHALAALMVLLLAFGPPAVRAADKPATNTSTVGVPLTGKTGTYEVPAYFEANQGQFPPAVRFVARMLGYTAWFTDQDVVRTSHRY